MPYKVQGNRVLHFKGGKWKVKQTCRSNAAAKSALRLLQGVEHGWKPTGKKARTKRTIKKSQRRR